MKVHVIEHWFAFSYAITNDYLRCGRLITVYRIPSLKTISRDITWNMHEGWSSKGILVASNMSVNYTIMYKIGVVSWAHSSYGSSITLNLVGLLYQIGTRAAFDFGGYAHELLVKHVELYVVKLPISLHF